MRSCRTFFGVKYHVAINFKERTVLFNSLIEILGTVLGIFGAYKLGDLRPNVVTTNAFFGVSNVFLLSYFIYNGDWWMVLLQSVYFFCAVRAIVNSIKRKRLHKVIIESQQSEHLNVNIF